MAKKVESRTVNVYINGSQAGKTIKELTAHWKKLNAELNQLVPGTEEYKRKLAELRGVGGQLDEHRRKVRGLKDVWGAVLREIRAFGLVALGALGAQAIIGQINQIILRLSGLSDHFADIQKTTGMSEQGVKDLNKELSKIHTRTARKELLDLAVIAGKLGITGQKDIKDFVEQADKIGVALAKDLGGDVEGTIRELGKLTDIFKIKDEFGIAEALNKTGSAINALGSKSTASEGFLVEFTKRVAGVAPPAGIAIDKVLGLASTLDQLGQTSEVSSTVFAGIIPDMFSDTATYAELAGMSVGEFTHLLNTDANEAFIKVLEGLNGNNEGYGVMVKKMEGLGIEGKRSITVLGALAENTELLRAEQKLSNEEFEKGTSLAQEFATKNENFAGSLARVQKFFQQKIVSTVILEPLEKFVGLLDDYIEIPASEKLEDERRGLNSLAHQLMATNPGEKRRTELISEIQSKYPDFLKNIDAETASNERLAARLKMANEQYILRIILAEKEEEIAEQRERVGKKMQEQFQNEENAGLAVTDINTILRNSGLDEINRRTNETVEEFAQRLREKTIELPGIIDSVGRKNAGELRRLLGIYQHYAQELGALNTKEELKENEDILATLEAELRRLEEWSRGKLGLTDGDDGDGEGDGADGADGADENDEKKKVLSEDEKKKAEEAIRNTKKMLKEIEDLNIGFIKDEEDRKIVARQKEFERRKVDIVATVADEKVKNNLIALEEKDLQNDLSDIMMEGIEKRLQANIDAGNQQLEEAKRIALADADFKVLAAVEGSEAKMKAEIERLQLQMKYQLENTELLESEKKVIVAKYLQEISDLRNSYLEIDTEEERAKHRELLQGKLTDMLDFMQVSGEERVLLQENLNMFIDAMDADQREKMEENWEEFGKNMSESMSNFFVSSTRSFTDARIAALDEELSAFTDSTNFKKDSLKSQLDSGLISEKKYRDAILKLDKDVATKTREVKHRQAKAEKEQAIFEAIVNTANAVIQALPNVALSVAVGFIGAAQTAAILAQPLPKLAGGGFSGPGIGMADTTGHAVAGVVHANEWVAPKWMVEDPYYGNVIATLEAVRMDKKGFAVGGPTTTTATPVPQFNQNTNAENKLMIMLLQQLLKRLDEPIKAVAVYGEVTVEDIKERIEWQDTIRQEGNLK